MGFGTLRGLDDLLQAQALGLSVLEQLGQRELSELDWSRWNPRCSLLQAADMLFVTAPPSTELERLAQLLVEFLARQRIVTRPLRRRLLRDIRRAGRQGTSDADSTAREAAT